MKKKHPHRAKSTHIALLCCLVTALSICCRQQTEITDDSPSLLLDGVDIEVLVNDNLDGSPVTAGLVRNNSDMLYSFHTTILYYNNREKLIGTYSSIVLDLYPGMEKAFYVFPPEDWSHAARVDTKITNIVKAEETNITPDFEFGNISVYHHEHGTRVLGELTNRGSDWQYSINILGAVVDADGKLKKANIHMIENLYPGETRMFAVDAVGEDTDATDGRVYLESIIEVAPAQDPSNITFSNLQMTYSSDIDRTSVLCDVVNRDERTYRNLRLLIGVYDGGKLTNLTWSSISRIGAGETIPFDQMLFDGNLADREARIHIDHVEVDE